MEMLPLCVTICSLEQCLSNLSTVHQCTRDKIIRCQAFLRKECWVHTDIWYYLNLPSVDRVVEDHHTVIVIINVKFQGLDLKCANIFITVGFLCLFVSIYTEVLVSGFAVTGTFASILPRAQSLKRRRRRRHKNDNVYDTLATHSALVQNIADRDCWAQNGTSHCHAFVTYKTCVCACMHVCICMHHVCLCVYVFACV